MRYFLSACVFVVLILGVGFSLQPESAAAQDVPPTAPTTIDQKLDKVIALLEQLIASQLAPATADVPVPPMASVMTPSAAPTTQQYDLPPRLYVPHPSLYLETGVGPEKTQMWNIEVKSGTVAVVGGYNVDGVGGGVYKAVGPGQLQTTVTDGFVSVVKAEWGNQEFCFRVGQAETFGWAHNTVQPLQGWTACNGIVDTTSSAEQASAAAPAEQPASAAVDPDTVTGRARVPTGDGKSMRFVAGDAVYGWSFVLDNGGECNGGNCYLSSAPSAGTLTSGVINPWKDEVSSLEEWQP